MRHLRLRFTALSLAAIAIAACDGGTLLEPAAGGARFTDNQCPPGEVCWEEPPGDTTPAPMVAQYRYFSTIYTGTRYGFKTARHYSVSEAIRFVASTTLDVRNYRYRAGCLPQSTTPPLIGRDTKSGPWSPLKLESVYYVEYGPTEIDTHEVRSSHSFTPIPNATGGGSFTHGWRLCY